MCVLFERNSCQVVSFSRKPCVFACSRSMTEASSIATHVLGIAIGLVIRDLLGAFSSRTECPACSVTCGSLTCPAVTCTTGHIEFSIFTWLVSGVLLGLICGAFWWWHRRRSEFQVSWPSETAVVKPLSSDVRRPLGTAIAWRPEGR